MQNTNIFEEALEFIPFALRELEIKIIPKYVHKDVQGMYNLDSGIIKIGTHEDTTIPIIWHEQMHKLLFEVMNFTPADDKALPVKVSIQFDNIAKELEKWLFNEINFPDLNYFGSTKHAGREK